MADIGLAWLGSALAFSVSMAGSPGPNNAMVAASGATWGFARTLPHMLGISIGLAAMLVAVALGAGEVLQRHAWLHDALRWGGGAYLAWLAWRIARADPDPEAASSAAGAGAHPLSFLQGALFQWVNPKAWMVALGAIAAYTDIASPGFLTQALLLAAVAFVATLPSVAFWTLVGVGAARVLRTRRAVRAFNLVMAALLAASLLPILAPR